MGSPYVQLQAAWKPRLALALAATVIAVLGFLALGCGGSASEAPTVVTVDDPRATTSLEGRWRFSAGDDPSWAQPAFDDGAWRTLEVPGIWRFQGVKTADFGWYRRRFDVGPALAGQDLGIEVPYTYYSDELFVNGRRVEGRYRLPSREGEMPAGSVNVFRVPAELLHPSGNLLALRVRGDMGMGGVYRENTRIGALATVERAFDREIVVQLGTAAICFFIGIYHLVIFFGRKEQRYAYLSYAAYALILSVFFPGYAGFWYVVAQNHWVNTIAEHGTFTAAVPIMPFFMHAYFRVRPNWFVRGAAWLTAFNLAWMFGELALRGTMTSYLAYFPSVVVAFSVTFAYAIVIVAQAVRRRENDSFLMMCAFAVFSITTTNDVLRFFCIIPGGLRLGHWGFLGFCIGMAIAIGNQYSRMMQSLAKLSTGLEAEVASQTSKLRSQNEQLVQQAEELRSLDNLKRQFYTNVSHELRTPLTLILGFGRALRKRFVGGSDPEAVHDVDAIQRNAAHLLTEINDLLDVARLEAGRMALGAAEVDLRALVRDVAANFAPAQGNASGRRLELELPAEPAPVYLDFDKIRKVVFNLLSNAFKFTSDQSGVVTVRVKPQEGGFVALEVEDNGIGIPAESLDHIFERFRQADNSSTRRYEGTGIGLALVKELTELHGGTVSVRSKQGEGSTFSIVFRTGKAHLREDQIAGASLPSEAVGELLAAVSAPSDTHSVSGPTVAVVPSDPGADILVVEDHRDLREYLTRLLSGYRVRSASDGRQALDRIKERVPKLVVSDVMMPNMDGYELCAAIKSDPATAHVPVILLTAQAGLAPKVRGLDVRADDYLTKPFHEEELLARVRNLLVIQRQNEEIREREAEVRETNQKLQVKVLEQADALQRRGRLGRFLPPQLVDELLGSAGVGLERQRRSVAILSAELCDFDELAGAVEPEDLTVLFGRFHTLTTEIVFKHGGTIASLHGGTLLAVFGAPKELPPAEAATAAVTTAKALLDGIELLGEMWREIDPGHDLVLRGGIALGHATVGAFGDGEWATFAAIGGPAAIAPRLCESADPGVVLVSSRAAKCVMTTHTLSGPRTVQTATWSQEVWRLEGRAAGKAQVSPAARSAERQVIAPPGADGADPVGITQDVFRIASKLTPGESTRAVSLRVGSVLGDRYRLDTELGRGGMGVVFAASDRLLGERVALKVLADPIASASDRLERLRREVRLARLVTHPNVCRVFDLQVLDGLACLTMELVDGRSLALVIHEGAVSPPKAVAWSMQICDALAAAHACGIVHRDLKPDNVLLDKRGRIVIADFGIARPINTVSDGQPEGIAGTLDYLAPEQLSSESPPDARSDIYALGVLLFELFTRELPFVGPHPMQRALARCSKPPRDPAEIVPTIDARLRAVILRCLRKDLNERFQRVGDVAAALAAVQVREVEAPPTRAVSTPKGPRATTLASG